MPTTTAPAPARRHSKKRRFFRRRTLLLILLIALGLFAAFSHFMHRPVTLTTLAEDWITVDLLPVNKYSRPGIELKQVNGIVVHYTGNPGTSAEQTKSYFTNLATSGETYASSLYHRNGRRHPAVRPAQRGSLLLQLQKRGHGFHRVLPPGQLRGVY